MMQYPVDHYLLSRQFDSGRDCALKRAGTSRQHRRAGMGRTTTCGSLAKELGAGPEAARDVGQAMAKIQWH